MFSFSVNMYDKNGDVFDRGIYLHHKKDNVIFKLQRVGDIDELIENLKQIKKECIEDYSEELDK